MGSLASEIRPAGDEKEKEKEKEINVLVTGFGPFLENRINPSYLIASALPKELAIPNLPKINIHVHPHPIEVSYANVLATIPALLQPAYDLTLNIGMAPSRAYYTLESRAHRDGYEKPDVRGEIPDDEFWLKNYNAPPVLQPTYDTTDVWRRWKSGVMNEDVRLSDHAGKYLCDYIYYACMLEYWLRDPSVAAAGGGGRGGAGERPCAFLHVPAAAGEEDVLRGTSVALAGIGAIVGSQVAWKRAGKGVFVPVPPT